MSAPMLALYQAAGMLLSPFARGYLAARARAGKEDMSRLEERFGVDGRARPDGRLIWLHAASVGESGVALMLIEALRAKSPDAHYLITTGTRTSADLIARRAPARTLHAYVPLDRPQAAGAFLDHWRPDLGVFIESEVWPNLIAQAKARGVKLALVNARMSPQTLSRWRRWRKTARAVFSHFDVVLAADPRTAEGLSQARGQPVQALGNLKLAAPPASVDAGALAALKAQIGARKVWLAASTHAGEDEIALDAHKRLRAAFGDALLILVPRHPERGAAIAALAGGAPRRSQKDDMGAGPVYVADTLGELALFYNAAPVALIAGSLLPQLKGHNPIEPAQSGAAIIAGPHVESFEDVFAALASVDGMSRAADAESVAARVGALWADEDARAGQARRALAIVRGGPEILDRTVGALSALARAHEPAQGLSHAPA